MNKKILPLLLVLILGCEKGSYKNQNSPPIDGRQTKVEKNMSYQITNLSQRLNQIYANGERFNYQFMGSNEATTKTFITGKELVIPILYETIENNLVLSIAILINLQTNEKQILVDNLIIDYNQFKKIIEKSALWIGKTESFDSKFILEKPLEETVEVSFPQNKTSKKFAAFMIFDGERKGKDLVLREEGNSEFQTVVSFKRNKIIYLNDKLNEEFILGAISENSKSMIDEIDSLNKAYEDLDLLLKKN
ncbi:hypothetical protein [uncultured Cetobacterium sp.]|uniref:hypothetical protein n=1 Tax=uncultured Cetobacterium sp. TaxID=527638 RepID=UPI00261548F7|nr:hypothetical protein [uncultured Cetobacterium sp.]